MNRPRIVAVVTGSRADFGLLRPVITALDAHPDTTVRLLVTGTHLLPPARTIDEVAALRTVDAAIPMQESGAVGRVADAIALGRGTTGFAAAFAADPRPDIVLVLGDRIEALAAAAAAAVGGLRVAHIHGGDRAAGVADDSMRHAISKLSHIHLPATPRSVERLLYLGEAARRIHLVGSPAIDDLAAAPPLDDESFARLGSPEILVLLHPTGQDDTEERSRVELLLDACLPHGRILALAPNHDPGREGIAAGIAGRAGSAPERITTVEHLDRSTFLGLLRRVRLLAGNSSAGRIEAAAVPVRVVDVGPRQSGRECPRHVIQIAHWDEHAVLRGVERARYEPIPPFRHPYGDGRAGPRIAEVLAGLDPAEHPLAKRNTY